MDFPLHDGALDSRFTFAVVHDRPCHQEPAMSDDTSKRGPADRNRINVNEDYEVRYWSEKFGVSEEQLRAAVARAGVMADDVERALRA
jgi:hypothetical protein